MSGRLSYVDELTWERVARDFDDVGPDACMAEIVDDLLDDNPHYLEMASRCARDVGDHDRIITGFCMFYRILAQSARAEGAVIPRIAPDTRDIIVAMMDEFGTDTFVLFATEALEQENPQLLQMASGFASRHERYLDIMRGFVLLYKSLSAQAVADRLRLDRLSSPA